MNAPPLLLFDLGGVLVEFSGVRDIAPLLRTKASESEILERWSRCHHSEQFGLGKLSPQHFSERFVRDWDLDVTPGDFLREFRSWSKCLLPGAAELLATLRPRFRLAALSNSNELHWDRNTSELGVTDLFEVAISSHQVGICKPDPGIYRVALDRLGVSPDAVMFFDDIQANVDAASALGIHAFRVDGVEGVRARLIKAGILWDVSARTTFDRRRSGRPLAGDARPCPRCGAVMRFDERFRAGRGSDVVRTAAWVCVNLACTHAEYVRADDVSRFGPKE
jgi:glucose-1-phosphatase